MVVFKFSVADMFELFQCIKAVLWCFQVFRGWIGDGTAHLKKMGTNKQQRLPWQPRSTPQGYNDS